MTSCALHGRASTKTCRRCGLFICDWCEKLAPSWGPGLCDACRKYEAPSGTRLRPLSRPMMGLLGLALWVGLNSLAWLVRADTWSERAVRLVMLVGSGAVMAVVLWTHRVKPPKSPRE